MNKKNFNKNNQMIKNPNLIFPDKNIMYLKKKNRAVIQ